MYQRSRRLRRNRSISNFEISLTPLIDTALTLLIIFMVTTPMLQNDSAGIKVNLPEGKAQENKGLDKSLTVVINDKGQLFFDGGKVSEDVLIKTLKNMVSSSNDETVFVEADRGVPYGKVIQLVDRIKYVGGVKYVALATAYQT